MNFVALKMLIGDRAKRLGLIFAIAFCMFLLENRTSIVAGISKRTASHISDITDVDNQKCPVDQNVSWTPRSTHNPTFSF